MILFQHALKNFLSSLFNPVNTHLSWQTARNQDSRTVNGLHTQSKKIQALVEWDEALHGPAGIDARGTYKAWQ